LSVWKVLYPTLTLAATLSLWLLYVSGGWIPLCNHNAKLVLFKDVEDMFYKLLARDREFNHPKWPFLIKVRDVEGMKMKDATFKHKIKGTNEFDAVIQAREAELHFDLKTKVVRIFLEKSEVQKFDHDADVMLINNDILEIPIPPDSQIGTEKKLQERSNAELVDELGKNRQLIATVRKRESIKAGFAFASGRLESINWTEVNSAFRDHADWIRSCNEIETEWHLRISMGIGSLLFVFLGAPVGILFAKRDFLSAFMTCFMPIIGLYYPLMLFGTNLSKEGLLAPHWSLWIGNGLMAILAGLVLPSVVKH
jgi:lipopolysaccharide export system permease protein